MSSRTQSVSPYENENLTATLRGVGLLFQTVTFWMTVSRFGSHSTEAILTTFGKRDQLRRMAVTSACDVDVDEGLYDWD